MSYNSTFAAFAACCFFVSHVLAAPQTSAPDSPPIFAERPDDDAADDAGRISLKQPGQRDFIVDLADLISSGDEAKIRQLATSLLNEKATPIVVVTIESMAKYHGAGMRIETFARLLFDQWGIGQAKIGDQLWNTGILLLVSRDDRKARIELGAGWRHDQDSLAQHIMNEQIVPRFRQGDFSGGILAGVEALDKMARGLELPHPPTPWWQPWLVIGAIGLMIFTVVSLIRRGSSGWAWLLWGVVFSILGYLLYSFLNSSRNSGGGGGFSGGSFGGGFSGGGGATGSW
ncbi:MAG TPA: TPM domain-containing protein [Pirellulales bacterium]